MKINFKRRILSIALSLLMVISVMPAAVFATDGSTEPGSDTPADVATVGGEGYKTLAEAIAAAQPGDTIKLLCDVTEEDGSYGVNQSGGYVAEIGGVKFASLDEEFAAANDSLITVDNTGNLIMIDRESNITVIDRSKKYGIAYDGDDTIIADENGERVYLGEEGTAVFYSDGEGGESVYRIQEPSSTADSGDPQSAQEGNGGSSNTVGIVIAVASAVAVPLMLMCFLCISRKRKGK